MVRQHHPWNRVAVLAAMLLLGTSGCSTLIIQSGIDVNQLKTREDVHRAFGEPLLCTTDEGAPCEQYLAHRKLVDHTFSMKPLYDLYTLGLTEIVLTPLFLCTSARAMIVGQRLHFVYDAEGHIVKRLVNHWPGPVQDQP